jgi:hypothetical protein
MRSRVAKTRQARSIPLIGLSLGMSIGILIGCAVCHWLTGRFTPGQFIGQGIGAGFGVLVGLYVEGRTSKGSKLLFVIAACSLVAMGALPFAVVLFRQ